MLSFVAQTLEGGEPGKGYDGGLRKREVGRFQCQLVFGNGHVLGKSTFAPAEYLISRPKLRHVLADRFNLPSRSL